MLPSHKLQLRLDHCHGCVTPDLEALREHILGHYLVPYVQIGANLYLPAVRHHRRLSVGFHLYWGGMSSMA